MIIIVTEIRAWKGSFFMLWLSESLAGRALVEREQLRERLQLGEVARANGGRMDAVIHNMHL